MEPIRKNLLAVLAEISEIAPDLRFGQMISNFAFAAQESEHETIYDIEDDKILRQAEDYLAVKRRHRSGQA